VSSPIPCDPGARTAYLEALRSPFQPSWLGLARLGAQPLRVGICPPHAAFINEGVYSASPRAPASIKLEMDLLKCVIIALTRVNRAIATRFNMEVVLSLHLLWEMV